MPNISIYRKINITKPADNIGFKEFANKVKGGHWKDPIERLREYVRDNPDNVNGIAKKKLELPGVTMSGIFTKRGKDDLLEHSGLICIDCDKLDISIRDRIEADPYSYACFLSCTGRGLAVIIKINPKKHLESFLSLEEYFLKKKK